MSFEKAFATALVLLACGAAHGAVISQQQCTVAGGKVMTNTATHQAVCSGGTNNGAVVAVTAAATATTTMTAPPKANPAATVLTSVSVHQCSAGGGATIRDAASLSWPIPAGYCRGGAYNNKTVQYAANEHPQIHPRDCTRHGGAAPTHGAEWTGYVCSGGPLNGWVVSACPKPVPGQFAAPC